MPLTCRGLVGLLECLFSVLWQTLTSFSPLSETLLVCNNGSYIRRLPDAVLDLHVDGSMRLESPWRDRNCLTFAIYDYDVHNDIVLLVSLTISLVLRYFFPFSLVVGGLRAGWKSIGLPSFHSCLPSFVFVLFLFKRRKANENKSARLVP